MKQRIATLLSACIIFCLPRLAAQQRSIASPDESRNNSAEVADKSDSRDWSAGAGIGLTRIYAQLPISTPQNAYYIYFEKDEGTGFSYGFKASSGGLQSAYPLYDLGSYNQFTSFDVHLSISLSAFFAALNKNYGNRPNIITRLAGNIYLGIGAGAIDNDIIRIKQLDSGKIKVDPDSGKPVIKTSSVIPYLPFNIGYNAYIKKLLFLRRIVLNANYQYTWCLGNYVDGYNMPFSGHKHTAVYTVASVGFRYYFTHYSSSKKGREQ